MQGSLSGFCRTWWRFIWFGFVGAARRLERAEQKVSDTVSLYLPLKQFRATFHTQNIFYCGFLGSFNCVVCVEMFTSFHFSPVQVRASCFAVQRANQRVLKFLHVLFNKSVPTQIQPVTSFDPEPRSWTAVTAEGSPPSVLMENKTTDSMIELYTTALLFTKKNIFK